MAATVEISAVLAGFPEAVAGLQKVGATAVKAGTDAARASADTAKAAQQATATVVGQQQTQQKAFEATARSTLGARQAFSSFAATLSGTSALLSLFARNNEALQRQLEVVAIASSAAGMSVRVLGAALRFVVTPIGAVVTAIAGAIAIFTHWETVQNAVVAAAIKTWTALGQFFSRLFGSMGSMASGLGKILFGAFTFDWGLITQGTNQIKAGLGELGQLAIDTGRQFAAGFQSALQALEALLGGLTQVGTKIEEFGLTPLELKLGKLGEAWGDLGKDIAEAQKLAADLARQEADRILTHQEEIQKGLLDSTLDRIEREREAQRQANDVAAQELENIGRLQQEIGARALEQSRTLAMAFAESFKSQMMTVQSVGQAMATSLVAGIQTVSNAIAQAIVFGEDLGETFANVIKNVAASVISMLIQIGIQQLASAILGATIGAKTLAADLGRHAATTFAGAFSAVVGIPIIGPAIAPGVAAASVTAMLAGAAASFATGSASGLALGATGAAGIAQGGLEEVPARDTFLLHRGERVLSRRQNVALEEFMAEGMGPGRRRAIIVHNHFEGPMFWDEITYERFIRGLAKDLQLRLRTA
jgi:hypothetical protein